MRLQKTLWLVYALAFGALAGGCFTSPPATETKYASYAGDRSSVSLGETVVAVRFSDSSVKWPFYIAKG